MKYSLLSVALCFLFSCATVDTPPGGPEDITPPQIVESTPDSAQTSFSGNQLKITFDEYFTTSDLASNLLISPPFSKPVKSRIKGKTLLIDLPEDLLPNTTYQFYFGNTISDLNENNKTKNLRLFFSTGTSIDSGSLTGRVLDAFTRDPIPDCKVFLYKEFRDSQLLLETPYYVSLTDKEGFYTFQNIAQRSYSIYALLDANNNNKLDIKEQFAFLPEKQLSDTTAPDLLCSQHIITLKPKFNACKEIRPGLFKAVFSSALPTKNLSITSSKTPDNSKTNVLKWKAGETNDTLYFFFQSKSIQQQDSIVFSIDCDTLKYDIPVEYTYKEPKEQLLSCTNKYINPNNALILSSIYPILKTNQTVWELTDMIDSTAVPIKNIILNDFSELSVEAYFAPGKKYRLSIPKEGYQSVNGLYNEPDTIFFNTLSSDETGSLEIQLNLNEESLNPGSTYLFVLEKERAKKPTEILLFDKDTVVTYNYLLPGTYFIYVYEDKDENNEWSNATYFKNELPEPIWRLNSPLEVRAKWENKNILLEIK